MVCAALVRRGGPHLDDLGRIVLVEHDVAGGVVAVRNPAGGGGGVEVQQVARVELHHVRPGLQLDLLLVGAERGHPPPNPAIPRNTSGPVHLRELPLGDVGGVGDPKPRARPLGPGLAEDAIRLLPRRLDPAAAVSVPRVGPAGHVGP